jgi:y4mF family transcriptional regulator
MVGDFVKTVRKNLDVTQRGLAMTAGTGMRFIIELEQGKPTCQLGKVLLVLNTLGISIDFVAPTAGSVGTHAKALRSGATRTGKLTPPN